MLASFKERKLMRRFAAVMNHRHAGFKANAMGVWAVPEAALDEIGPQMAGFALVSHCYRRPTYEDWPYSVFTMVHGKNARECEQTIAAIRDETGVDEYALLWSIKEYKKTRVRYFTSEWDGWREQHLAARPGRADRRRPRPRRHAGLRARRPPQQRGRVAAGRAGARRRHRPPRARGADRRVRGGRRGGRTARAGVPVDRDAHRCAARRDRARRERHPGLGPRVLLTPPRARRPRAHVAGRVREQRHRDAPGRRDAPARRSR